MAIPELYLLQRGPSHSTAHCIVFSSEKSQESKASGLNTPGNRVSLQPLHTDITDLSTTENNQVLKLFTKEKTTSN